MDARAEEFYKECLERLNDLGVPYMVAGTFAINFYTGMKRDTKDLDIFTKASDFPKVLHAFKEWGFETGVLDERWLAKVRRGEYYFDVIFNGGNSVTPITDDWLKESRTGKIYDVQVKLLPPTELVWSKMFVEDRNKYEGNDVAHVILKQGKELNWKRLLSYSDQYWEVLLIHILNFRFIYPSEREEIPHWLLTELIKRLESQIKLPTSEMKICRGRLFSRGDFAIDVNEWGFADIVGDTNERNNHTKNE